LSELQKTESALVNDLEEFLRAYKDRTGNYKYFDRINNLMAANSTSLVVDYIDFDTFKPDLAKLITNEPDEMFDAFNRAIFNVLYEIHPDYANETQNNIKVRIGNYTVQKSLREINAEVINKLVGVSGMVVRSSEVKPLAKKIGYRCLSCGEITEAQLRGLVLKKPLRCGKCSEKELEMDPDTSIFIDFQK
jgi:replicative DNA helicase Mcm